MSTIYSEKEWKAFMETLNLNLAENLSKLFNQLKDEVAIGLEYFLQQNNLLLAENI